MTLSMIPSSITALTISNLTVKEPPRMEALKSLECTNVCGIELIELASPNVEYLSLKRCAITTLIVSHWTKVVSLKIVGGYFPLRITAMPNLNNLSILDSPTMALFDNNLFDNWNIAPVEVSINVARPQMMNHLLRAATNIKFGPRAKNLTGVRLPAARYVRFANAITHQPAYVHPNALYF
jgi:Leucine-rich repeat (LRR) protein